MTTGEYEATQPEKAAPLNLTFDRALSLLALIGMICGSAGTYAVMQDRVETMRGTQTAMAAELAAEREARQQLSTRLAITEAGFAAMVKTLDEMRGDIKEIKTSVSNVAFVRGGR